MTQLLMARDGNCLKPVDEADVQALMALQDKSPVLVSIETMRNPLLLRKYWLLSTAVADNCDDFYDRYDADAYARARMRWMVREIEIEPGKVMIRPRSIALHKMQEEEFRRFFDRALYLWGEKLGIDPMELIQP